MIQQLMADPVMSADRYCISLFNAYRTATRKTCAKCNKNQSLSTSITMLKSVCSTKRSMLEQQFGVPTGAVLSVFVDGGSLGIRVK